MNQEAKGTGKEAILVVSFGTSYEKTCRLTIEAIENSIQNAYPDRPVYRAWTSLRIIKKVKETRNIHINTVSEALEQMAAEHVTDIIVQPTHVINGFETEYLLKELELKKELFLSIRCGSPLLTTKEDCRSVALILSSLLDKREGSHMYALMGHGTEHDADKIYREMNDFLCDNGRADIMIGTVEGAISIDDIVRVAKEKKVTVITLLPFMIVAGDHANNDMAGEDPDSWASILNTNGIKTTAILKGLGEYDAIREMFIQHCRSAK